MSEDCCTWAQKIKGPDHGLEESDGKPLVWSREDGHGWHKFFKSRSGCWIENRLQAGQKPKYKGQLAESRQQMMLALTRTVAVEVLRNGQILNIVKTGLILKKKREELRIFLKWSSGRFSYYWDEEGPTLSWTWASGFINVVNLFLSNVLLLITYAERQYLQLKSNLN